MRVTPAGAGGLNIFLHPFAYEEFALGVFTRDPYSGDARLAGAACDRCHLLRMRGALRRGRAGTLVVSCFFTVTCVVRRFILPA